MKPIIKAEIERDLAEGTVAIYVIGFHFPSPFGSAFHSRAGTSFKDCSWVEWKNNSDWFNLQRFWSVLFHSFVESRIFDQHSQSTWNMPQLLIF